MWERKRASESFKRSIDAYGKNGATARVESPLDVCGIKDLPSKTTGPIVTSHVTSCVSDLSHDSFPFGAKTDISTRVFVGITTSWVASSKTPVSARRYPR